VARQIVVNPPCRMCGEGSTLEVSASEYLAIEAYRKGYGLIHEILPNLTPDERELVKTGIHPACWPQGFDLDPDDYDEESLP
jgi:hypothetical protein